MWEITKNRFWYSWRVLILASLLLIAWILPTEAASYTTEFLSIPLSIKNVTIYDDARLVKPAGEGPFPLIVLTHGTPRSAEERKNTDVINYYKAQTEYFVDKGYAVLFVVRRGFGASTASYAENLTLSNGEKDYWRAGLEAAKDLKAAIDYAKSRQDIEKNQIVLVGQSTGGHSVIATGSLNIEGIRGIINFAGGRGSYAPDLVRDESNLIDSMAQYGKTSTIPTLWLYSANDHYFRPTLARAMYKAYTENGGQALFIQLPSYGTDGHKSFVGNRNAWSPYVEQFLTCMKEKA
nr:alpha/beta hydrolase [uncultured Anaeromusa sp.]